MKILIVEYERYDETLQRLIIDGNQENFIGHVEPEDAIIGRDLTSADDMAEYIKMGFDAAMRGETLEIERKVCKTAEEWEEYE